MGFTGFLGRLVFAAALVLVTYNPAGYSYVHWVRDGFEADTALKALAGIVLLIAFVICLRATFRSIGLVGAGLVVALLASIGWVLVDYGWLAVDDPGVLQWLILLGAGLILGIGLSWSHVRRGLSGQMDTDDVEE